MKFLAWLKSLFATKTYPPAPVIVKAETPAPVVPKVPVLPPWYEIALKEIGVKAVSGSGNSARVLEYDADTSLHATSDDVAWCAAFISWVFVQAKLISKKSAWARDWLEWGVALKEPVLGCVVVFKRGSAGHVALYKSGYKTGVVQVLGGNQGNAVSIAGFVESNVLGYRWPTDYPLPVGAVKA